MDKHQLIEDTASRTGAAGDDGALAPHDVERVLDALFGTVEHPGLIAEAVRTGERVVLGSFGDFHGADDTIAFRPGKALDSYLRGGTG
ncbi:HU family DNA-binding protein [Streptomyces apricus]|uniref:HU family DNA-binding protein n=1 Tax=Streptomyces apricus TaxID=1828112 RepID=A0A5B0BK59_9ACTN|nr:HU family DNA-binding protein [Streptomyces apricus]KAA0942598.1 HU family DNA-binding protein [Streptomyces apricus]